MSLNSKKNTSSISLTSPRVIVACALFCAALLSSFAFAALSNKTSGYWVAAHPISIGSLITSEDLILVDATLAENGGLYLTQDLNPIGSTSISAIGTGEFIALNSITEETTAFDSEQVPINIAASDIPADIEIGELISLYWVPEPLDRTSLSTPELLLTGVFLRSIDHKNSNFGNGLAITISVDNSQVKKLLSGTSSGRLVVVGSHG